MKMTFNPIDFFAYNELNEYKIKETEDAQTT